MDRVRARRYEGPTLLCDVCPCLLTVACGRPNRCPECGGPLRELSQVERLAFAFMVMGDPEVVEFMYAAPEPGEGSPGTAELERSARQAMETMRRGIFLLRDEGKEGEKTDGV